MKKKIFIIVGYYYLSEPLYRKFLNFLPEFEITLVSFSDYLSPHSNDYVNFDKLKSKNTKIKVLSNKAFRTFRNIKSKNKILKIIQLVIGSLFLKNFKENIEIFLNEHKPDLVVYTSDMQPSFPIVRNIMGDDNIVLVQPCFLDLWDRSSYNSIGYKVKKYLFSGLFSYGDVFGMSSEPVKLFVWEKNSYDVLSDKGRECFYIENPFVPQNKIYSKSNEGKILVCPSDHSPNLGSDFQTEINKEFENVFKIYDEKFILKIHPNEDKNHWLQRLNIKNPKNVEIVQHADLEELFKFSKVVISCFSNVTVQALSFGIPSFNLCPELPEDFNNYEQRFAPYYNERLKNTDQLKMKLENLTRDKSYEDNKSSQSNLHEINKGNIFEIIEEQLNG